MPEIHTAQSTERRNILMIIAGLVVLTILYNAMSQPRDATRRSQPHNPYGRPNRHRGARGQPQGLHGRLNEPYTVITGNDEDDEDIDNIAVNVEDDPMLAYPYPPEYPLVDIDPVVVDPWDGWGIGDWGNWGWGGWGGDYGDAGGYWNHGHKHNHGNGHGRGNGRGGLGGLGNGHGRGNGRGGLGGGHSRGSRGGSGGHGGFGGGRSSGGRSSGGRSGGGRSSGGRR